ncbi:MAG: phosphoribosyltransferase family protein [Thermoanaerobacteraceae bacterium]|nr:phosphoribosyltransferase family protein [Thermoanaerobacteraceae bacterium]
MKEMDIEKPFVLGIPRGGAVVAHYAAYVLKCPWDFIFTHKLRSPMDPELSIGAVTQDGCVTLDHTLIYSIGVNEKYLEEEASEEYNMMKEYIKKYRDSNTQPVLNGKNIIVVDDGIATGYTARAALMSLSRHDVRGLYMAAPVASKDAVEQLKKLSTVIILQIPEVFYSVSQFYRDFSDVREDEIINLYRSQAFFLIRILFV